MMSVFIDYNHNSNSIGNFFRHLALSHSCKGVFADKASKSSTVLCGPTLKNGMDIIKNKKVIQRLDGIYFNSEDSSTISKNNEIKKLYNIADGVIFQSEFCKKMIFKQFQTKPKLSKIIYNGFTPPDNVRFQKIIEKYFPEFSEIRKYGKKIFAAGAVWRPIKRLDSIVEGFNIYNQKHDDAILVVAGRGGKKYGKISGNVYYLEDIKHDYLMSIFSISELVINLSFSDACPNVIIEALAFKKPVLITETQGVAEIFNGNGFCIKENLDWDFGLYPYSKIPQISPEAVADGIEKALQAGYNRDINVSMEKCAKQYLDFFEEVSK